MRSPSVALHSIKLVHTIVWAFFAGCILAIPAMVWLGNFDGVLVLTTVVFVEVFVIMANRGRCPLTAIAARYTEDRRENFDIYLPLWLARHNKLIFGGLFGVGLLLAIARWRLF